MTNKPNNKTQAAWKHFEKSGSIEAFLKYHEMKPSKTEKEPVKKEQAVNSAIKK